MSRFLVDLDGGARLEVEAPDHAEAARVAEALRPGRAVEVRLKAVLELRA